MRKLHISKEYIKGPLMYIIQADLEYLVSILVSGSFLAFLTGRLGISDSLTGIISSFISLGCLFQLFAVFVKFKRTKPTVIIMSVANQLLFMSLYLIPLINANKTVKTVLFVIAIIAAWILFNIAHPQKLTWLMSLIDDNKRGSFTADKEIISLLSGMGFSFGMGFIADHFKAQGKYTTVLIISAVTIFALTLFHTLTLINTTENEPPLNRSTGFFNAIKGLVRNKAVLSILVVYVLYFIVNYITIPFYATYQLNDLGFSLSFVSILSIISSLTRIFASRPWGKYADRTSFSLMIEKALWVLAISKLCAAFIAPGNAKIMFTVYYMLYGVAMGGVNSALMNMIYDRLPAQSRTDCLAFCQAFAGLAGFLATIVTSPVITVMQQNGNRLFNFPLYAQQLLSFCAFVVLVLLILYVRFIIIRKETPKK